MTIVKEERAHLLKFGRVSDDIFERLKGEDQIMKSSRTVFVLSLVLATGCLTSSAHAEGDIKKGKKVFNKCKACHNIDKDKNKVGPHLVGIFGREAGALEDFKYSDAMKNSGVVWDAETLTAYVKKPKEFIEDTKMNFAGVKKDKQIVDLIAYMEDASKPE